MVAQQMGLTANNHFLFCLTFVLSLILHAFALSYLPVTHHGQVDSPAMPSLSVNLSKITHISPAGTQKTENNRKQPMTPQKHSPKKIQLVHKPVETAHKPRAQYPIAKSAATPSMIAPVERIKTELQEKTMPTTAGKQSDTLPLHTAVAGFAKHTSPSNTTQPQTPAYLDNPKPLYPLAAKRRGMQGNVLLLVTVGSTGTATQISVKKSSGFRLLDRAAKEAVGAWQFVPATKDGVSIEAIVEIPVRFELVQG